MKKVLITAALPYVNNIPHLGNIIGSVLSADAFARICRLKNKEVFFVCATDEYGTTTEIKAREEGLSPQNICDKYHVIHDDIYKYFDISFDFFGRTSFAEQTEITQQVYFELEKNGYILEKKSKQLFCPQDKIFLADRFIKGTCPHCGKDDARGDQCDFCSKLLQPTDLKNPHCQLCGSVPLFKETKHLYLDLEKLSPKVDNFFKKSSVSGFWPENAVTATSSWLKQGLRPRPITRDLKWGVSVPKKGYEDKVFYVWFDAVLGYISNTKRALGKKWLEWWHKPEDVELFQFMAKDNIPFHTIIFPAMLLGSDSKWTMLHHISSVEYLNYENQKFSKSRNIGIFGDNIIDSNIKIDWWRLYLLANRPETADSNFNWHDFTQDINANFIDNIGNLINRVTVLITKNFTLGLVNDFQDDKDLLVDYNNFTAQVQDLLAKMDKVQIKESIRGILDLGRFGNKVFQSYKPWKLVVTDPKKALAVLSMLVFFLRDCALLLQPFIPQVALSILEQLNFKALNFDCLLDWKNFNAHQIKPPKVLFKKLEAAEIENLKLQYTAGLESSPEVLAFKKLDIRVGKIISVNDHPTKEHLYVLETDVGGTQKLKVLAGLKNKFKVGDIIGKSSLFILNLESRDFDGIKSEAMLLVASKNSITEIIEVNDSIGSRLHIHLQNQILGNNFTADDAVPTVPFDLLKAAELKIENRNLKLKDNFFLAVNGNIIQTKEILNAKVK